MAGASLEVWHSIEVAANGDKTWCRHKTQYILNAQLRTMPVRQLLELLKVSVSQDMMWYEGREHAYYPMSILPHVQGHSHYPMSRDTHITPCPGTLTLPHVQGHSYYPMSRDTHITPCPGTLTLPHVQGHSHYPMSRDTHITPCPGTLILPHVQGHTHTPHVLECALFPLCVKC